jgi:ubiquitin-protein ligase
LSIVAITSVVIIILNTVNSFFGTGILAAFHTLRYRNMQDIAMQCSSGDNNVNDYSISDDTLAETSFNSGTSHSNHYIYSNNNNNNNNNNNANSSTNTVCSYQTRDGVFARRRLQKDINDISMNRYDADTDFRLHWPDGYSRENITFFYVDILPRSGLYKGCCLPFSVTIPPKYPFVPPVIVPRCAILHPLINFRTNNLLLDIVQQHTWKPVVTLNTVIFGLQLMFVDIRDLDVQQLNQKGIDLEVKHWYETSRQTFEHLVQQTLRGEFVLGTQWKNMYLSGANAIDVNVDNDSYDCNNDDIYNNKQSGNPAQRSSLLSSMGKRSSAEIGGTFYDDDNSRLLQEDEKLVPYSSKRQKSPVSLSSIDCLPLDATHSSNAHKSSAHTVNAVLLLPPLEQSAPPGRTTSNFRRKRGMDELQSDLSSNLDNTGYNNSYNNGYNSNGRMAVKCSRFENPDNLYQGKEPVKPVSSTGFSLSSTPSSISDRSLFSTTTTTSPFDWQQAFQDACSLNPYNSNSNTTNCFLPQEPVFNFKPCAQANYFSLPESSFNTTVYCMQDL